MRWWHLRAVVNVINGSTLLGVVLALATGCRLSRGPRGLVLATSYPHAWPRNRALTLGNVIITRYDMTSLVRQQPLLCHEERHAWQYVACLGLPLLPLYAVASLYSMLRGGDVAVHNVFERLAGLHEGGYPTVSARARARAGGIRQNRTSR